MQMQFSIREMIRHDFGVDLPLGLGSGTAIDDPLEILGDYGDDPVVHEREYLKYLVQGRQLEWQWLERQSVELPGITIDVVQIETTGHPDSQEPAIENYYFNSSRCVLKYEDRRLSYSDFPELLKRIGEFDHQCREGMSQADRVEHRPWLANFGENTPLQAENLAIWQQLLTREINEGEAEAAMQILIKRYYDALDSN